MNKIKYLIACDLDGTLLKEYSFISEFTAKVIKRVIDEGHIFCIVTGRPFRGSFDFYNQLSLDTIMINQNGSYITNPSDIKFTPIIQTFNISIAIKLFSNKIIKSFTMNALIEGVNKGWMLKKPEDIETKKMMFEMFHLEDRDITIINDNLECLDTDISSILIHINKIDFLDFNLLLYEIKNIAPTLVVRNWSLKNNGNIIEINSDYASKRNALKYLSSYYGIPRENCIAIGDGDNDVGMLSYASWGFALKNASQAACLAARYMTKFTNDDDGVAKELLEFLKIKL